MEYVWNFGISEFSEDGICLEFRNFGEVESENASAEWSGDVWRCGMEVQDHVGGVQSSKDCVSNLTGQICSQDRVPENWGCHHSGQHPESGPNSASLQQE